MASDIAISVSGLTKRFRDVVAVDDISFEVEAGSLRRHALPWLARRVRQVSSGDGRGPKRPEPTLVALPPAGVRARD